MSDLKPKGVDIELNGSNVNFLFTLNVIDDVQSEFGMNCIKAMDKMFNGNDAELSKTIKTFVRILYNDWVERSQESQKDFKGKTITDRQAGRLVSVFNLDEVRTAIIKAYGISLPEPSEDDEDTKAKSETQN